jgi:flagellar biosynthesis protein FliP
MKRIKTAYLKAKKEYLNSSKSYEYKYGLLWAILLIIPGILINNIFGSILIVLGLFMSPAVFFILGFWTFVLSLISDQKEKYSQK